MGLFSRSEPPTGDPGRGLIVYYDGPSHDHVVEAPEKNLILGVKLDIQTAPGTSSVKTRLRGQIAWLLAEGMQIPVLIDPATGMAVAVDKEGLETELAGRADEHKAEMKKQSSLRYSMGIEKEQIADLKDLAGRLRRKKRSD